MYGHPKDVPLKETGSVQVTNEPEVHLEVKGSQATLRGQPDQRQPALPKDKPRALSTPNPASSLDETAILPRDGSE